ncbi:MAG: class I SAM-dependent methyltransferase [Eubacteriales bacterium]|jgi:23S rRNA (cytosine1962-C5)-methyltransferase
MWSTDAWRDFRLLDCGSGEKLEQWGSYVLVRPDPQAIWDSPRTSPLWRTPHARYIRSSTGGGRWDNLTLPPAAVSAGWDIRYRNLTFRVKPMAFKHTGIFPEQAVNWDFITERVTRRLAMGKPMRILNLFAYTGAATVAALKAGAEVCHVDAARGMVSWAKENAQVSGVADRPVRWIVDDCTAFVERELRRGHSYDAIIMDPPSYGRGPTGQIWKMEDSLYPFVKLCVRALSDAPDFVLLSAYTAGLNPGVAGYVLGAALKKERGGEVTCEELGLRCESTGLHLPCGCSARWTA